MRVPTGARMSKTGLECGIPSSRFRLTKADAQGVPDTRRNLLAPPRPARAASGANVPPAAHY
jgi:hypothetical protein